MKYKVIVGIISGTVLACAGGSALGIAIWLYGGGHRMSEPALEGIGMMFGMVAFVLLAIAAFLFIWVCRVYREAKRYRTTGILPPTKKSIRTPK